MRLHAGGQARLVWFGGLFGSVGKWFGCWGFVFGRFGWDWWVGFYVYIGWCVYDDLNARSRHAYITKTEQQPRAHDPHAQGYVVDRYVCMCMT